MAAIYLNVHPMLFVGGTVALTPHALDCAVNRAHLYAQELLESHAAPMPLQWAAHLFFGSVELLCATAALVPTALTALATTVGNFVHHLLSYLVPVGAADAPFSFGEDAIAFQKQMFTSACNALSGNWNQITLFP